MNQHISIDQLKKWYKTHFESILKDFKTFLSFPSISTDLKYADSCRATAQWLFDYLEAIGLDAQIWETSGLPVVFASYLVGVDRPTLLIYHHYDVQPVDPIELWHSKPFEPTIRENQIFARGAVDNKGQCFYTLTALKALFEMAKQGNVNIKIIIEGEEECGSRGTSEILKIKQKELEADHLLVIDFDMHSLGVPGITLGMRGLITLNVECTNSSIDLHSGSHGGIALNPNRALAKMLTSLWDENGKIAISHFYDTVLPLSKEDLSCIDMTFDELEYRKDFGVNAFCNEKGYSLKESNGLRPSLEINGMWGGYTGPGFKTVIPAKAFAKISCRLVPNQEPEDIAKKISVHLKNQAPVGIQVKVEIDHGASSYRSKLNSTIVKTVAMAYEGVFDKPCHYLLCGASVPIVVELALASGADVAMIGMGLASDDIHAPNEHFGLDRFELGFLTVARIITLIDS